MKMKNDYEILKSLLSWLKFHQIPIEIVTTTGNFVRGYIRKFDDCSLLLDESGTNVRSEFKTINYSAIESVKNSDPIVVKGDLNVVL